MKINRELLDPFFALDSVPKWLCPWCSKSSLFAEKEDFKVIESAQSKAEHSHEDWEPYYIRGTFSGVLKCSSDKCMEQVIVSGLMQVDEKGGYYDNDYYSTYEESLKPLFFVPAIPLFPIRKDVRNSARESVLEVFSVFWHDISSCGNKIRKVVEVIIDDKKIPKQYIDKKRKRREHNLHARIEIFSKRSKSEKEQKAADLLMAIKWIGNSGSHISSTLTRADILDGLEILNHVLELLYDKEYLSIYKLSKEYNKSRGPLKRPPFGTRHL